MRPIIQDREELHKRYGGEIFEEDFNTYTPSTGIANRISYDRSREESLFRLQEMRNRKLKK